MTKKERIAAAGNTLVPSILTLRSLGFSVRVDRTHGAETWVASDERVELVASDPHTLLGLACMRLQRGSVWAASDEDIESVLREYLDGDAG